MDIFCKYCGNKLSKGMRFCGVCGKPIADLPGDGEPIQIDGPMEAAQLVQLLAQKSKPLASQPPAQKPEKKAVDPKKEKPIIPVSDKIPARMLPGTKTTRKRIPKWVLITGGIVILGLLLLGIVLQMTKVRFSEWTGFPTKTASPAFSSAETSQPALPFQQTIVVVTDATYPPFEMIDETSDELIGFDIDLMNAIAEKNGWSVEWVNTSFDAVLAGVADCSYDLSIAAIAITDERKVDMDFSNPYYDWGQVVVVRAGETSIAVKEDLEGRIVAAVLGTAGEVEAQAIPSITIRTYDSFDVAIQALVNDQVDAVITDVSVASLYVQSNPGEIKIIGEQFAEVPVGIAVCKDRADLIEPINTALSSLSDDGTLNQLVMKWLLDANQ